MRTRRIYTILLSMILIGSMIMILDSEVVDAVEFNDRVYVKNAHASFEGEAYRDELGYEISQAGDVNGDGFDDFILGSPRNCDWGDYSGKTYLFFGKIYGWEKDMNVSNADVIFHGESARDFSGESIAGVGDVNDDGYDDIVIGAYMNDENGDAAGQAYLILGKREGWQDDINLSDADASFHGEFADDQCGGEISRAGDINGDGYDDILIGAEDFSDSKGKTYLILGKKSGWRSDVNISVASRWSFVGEADDDHSSKSLAGAGDVNGDGYDDILIGAPYNNEIATVSGKVYLILGGYIDHSRNISLGSSIVDASFRGESSYDYAGYGLNVIGDINSDGYDDIAIGAPERYYTMYYRDDGEVYIIFGKTSGWSINVSLSNADASMTGNSWVESLGTSISGPGDFNGDGFSDFLISSRLQPILIKGRETGWSMNMDVYDCPGIQFLERTYNWKWSDSSFAGDVNGDGYDDMLLGARYNDGNSQDSGEVWLFNSFSVPPPIRNISARCSKDGSKITVSWNTSFYWNEPITNYRILRSTDGNNFEHIGDAMGVFNDTGVSIGVAYTYAVVCVDGDGALSDISGTATILCDLDTDGDGIVNLYDDDDDGDGYDDGRDMFPLDRREYIDTDLDGHGNFGDMDDDNDGVLDMLDPYPLNPLDGTMTLLDDIETSINGMDAFIQEINGSLSGNLSRIEMILTGLNLNLTDTGNALKLMDTKLSSLISDVDFLEDEVTSLLSEVIYDLSGLNETLSTQIADLENQLETDIASLLSAIGALESSIQADLDSLSDDVESFRTWMELQLTGLSGLIGDENEELETLITSEMDLLESTTLAGIHSLLDSLIQSCSKNDTAILAKLIQMNDELTGFENSSFERLESISNDMATIQTLDELSSDIEAIDQDLEMLSELEKNIEGVSEEQEDASGKIGLGNILNILIIILLVAVLGVLGYSIWKRRGEEAESWK